VDIHVITQAKILCTLCLKCKHVYLGIHDSSKCSPSYAEHNIICLNTAKTMGGDGGDRLRKLLHANFNGMTCAEIYDHHAAKVMEKTQKHMELFKVHELNFHIDKSYFKVCMFEWVLKAKDLYHLPKFIEKLVSVQKSASPIFSCGCKMLFITQILFELHIKKCEHSGFILPANVSRQLQNYHCYDSRQSEKSDFTLFNCNRIISYIF